jgi:hypothetical protein
MAQLRAPVLALCVALACSATKPSAAFASYKRLRRALPWARRCQYYNASAGLPSEELWQRRHVRGRHPCVLRGGLARFGPTAQNWTDPAFMEGELLRAGAGAELWPHLFSAQPQRRRSVLVQGKESYFDRRVGRPVPLLRTPYWDQQRPTSMAEAIGMMRATRDQPGTFAVGVLQDPLEQPSLRTALAPPRRLARALGRLNHLSMWLRSTIDARPSESGTHFDADDNFMLQLRGSKKVVMFPPTDTHLLYSEPLRRHVEQHPRFLEGVPHFYNSRHPHSRGVAGGASLDEWLDADEEQHAEKVVKNVSPVELSEGSGPDLGRFPAFRRARPQVCTIAPGDVLWMPALTWHDVFSFAPPGEDSSDGMNWMVNLWLEDERGAELRTAVRGVLAAVHEKAKKKN